MKETELSPELVTPGDVLGDSTELKPGKGAYVNDTTVFASLTGIRRIVPPLPQSLDQRATVEVTGHKAHGLIPEPGSVVLARVTKVMARMATVDILCVGSKAVREKFAGLIRQQDVRATEIDKVDMHSSFRPGDIVRAMVLSLGDARAYYLSTAKNELGVVSAESAADKTRFVFQELLKISEEEFGLSTEGPITFPFDSVFLEYLIKLIKTDSPRTEERL